MNSEQQRQPFRAQLSVADGLWITASIAVILAFTRQFRAAEMLRSLSAMLPAIAVVGLAAQQLRPRNRVWFWTTIGCLAATLCAFAEALYSPAFFWGWSLVGAIGGAVVGVGRPPSIPRRMVVGGLLALVVFLPLQLLFTDREFESWIEPAVSPLAVALLIGTISLVDFWRARRDASWGSTAFAITAGLVLGNLVMRAYFA